MKTFEEYQFRINHNQLSKGYKYSPSTKEELKEVIEKEIKEQGPEADLNCIDTSNIEDMSMLFNSYFHKYTKNFNGDISEWDVSNVKNMNRMFCYSKNFNGDISNWNVSNVKDTSHMFCGAERFNQNISGWDVSDIENMSHMFYCAERFNGDISSWNVSNVKDMTNMFQGAKNFNQDISKWNVSKVKVKVNMFIRCPIKEEYKPKFKK